MSKTFSANLKRLRLEKKLTQEQVAESLGVSPQSVSRWECGTTLPDVMLLPDIARLYCVTVDDLYKESSSAYANYAQRLAGVYEHTQRPEDFMAVEAEFCKLFQSGDYQADDVRIYGVMHHYMMKYCRDKALELFDQIIEHKADGDEEAYYRTRGQKISLLSDIGRNDESINAQLQIIEQGGTVCQEYAFLIIAYCYAGEYQLAYDWFQKAASKFPEDWAIYVYGGDVCKELKRYDEAFMYWDKSLELNEKYMDARFSKAFAYEELGDYEKAYRGWCEIADRLRAEGFEAEVQSVVEKAQKCKERISKSLHHE